MSKTCPKCGKEMLEQTLSYEKDIEIVTINLGNRKVTPYVCQACGYTELYTDITLYAEEEQNFDDEDD